MDAEADILAYRDGFAQHSHVASTLLHERKSGHAVVITIAIPTYRRLALLKQALASAAAQRTDVSFEILVVDNDHESDGRETIEHLHTLDTPDLRYFHNEQNIGMFGNWNRCLTLARGEWITILNDDDLLDSDFISESLSKIGKEPSIRLLASHVRTLDERSLPPQAVNLRRLTKGRLLRRGPPDAVRPISAMDYFLGNPHQGSLGILLQTRLGRELGGYSPDLFPSADYVFLVRYLLAHGSHLQENVLASYRILVNESLKPSVVRGWVVHGLKIREELMRWVGLRESILRLYSRLVAADAVFSCRDHFGIGFDFESLLRQFSLPRRFVFMRTRMLRLWIRMVARRKSSEGAG